MFDFATIILIVNVLQTNIAKGIHWYVQNNACHGDR